jgi:hypothetical protein
MSIQEKRKKAVLETQLNYGAGVGIKSRLEFLAYALENGAKATILRPRDYKAEERLAKEIEAERTGWDVPLGNERHPKTIAHMAKREKLKAGVFKESYYMDFGGHGWHITKIEYFHYVDEMGGETNIRD